MLTSAVKVAAQTLLVSACTECCCKGDCPLQAGQCHKPPAALQIQLRSRAGILPEVFPNPEDSSPLVLGKKGSIYCIGLSFLIATEAGTGRSTPVLLFKQTPPPKPAEKKTCKINFFPFSEFSQTPQDAQSVHVLLHAASSGHSILLHAGSRSAHILGKELHLPSQWPGLKARDHCQTVPGLWGDRSSGVSWVTPSSSDPIYQDQCSSGAPGVF